MLEGFDDRSDKIFRKIGRILNRPLQLWCLSACIP